MADDDVELSDVIRQVRGDLEHAMWAGEEKDLRFRLGDVELQLEVAVTRSTRPGAKVRLMVVDAEAKLERSTVTRHHIKVTLHPRRRDAPEEQPWVAGTALDDEI